MESVFQEEVVSCELVENHYDDEWEIHFGDEWENHFDGEWENHFGDEQENQPFDDDWGNLQLELVEILDSGEVETPNDVQKIHLLVVAEVTSFAVVTMVYDMEKLRNKRIMNIDPNYMKMLNDSIHYV